MHSTLKPEDPFNFPLHWCTSHTLHVEDFIYMLNLDQYGCRNGAKFNISKFHSYSTLIHSYSALIFIHFQHLYLFKIQHLYLYSTVVFGYEIIIHSTIFIHSRFTARLSYAWK